MLNKSEPEDTTPTITNQDKSCPSRDGQPCTRFHTPDELREYLEHADQQEIVFRAYPIAGEPETFRYLNHEQTVVRSKDGRTFDSMEDFLCYTFQCDPEGYSGTEYVDVVEDEK